MTRAIRAALLRYYDAHARALPWRARRDPYAVWVSEVMLQQTRVQTVLGYYERFLSRFPTLQALAAAREDEVLALWSGLGYYRRARLLHAGVREAVVRYGAVPRDAEALRALPGVGRYTAGAIGSIAFGRQVPVVDGNVARVLCRLHGIETPLGRKDTEARLWALAEALVRGARPGDLNQALMELGATLCSKRAPRCDGCPVARRCRARARGLTEALPRPRPRRAPRPVSLCAVVVTNARGDVVLVRGEGAAFGGLRNLPMAEGKGLAAARAALARHGVAALIESKPVAVVTHTLTHRALTVAVYAARARRRADARALPRAELGRVAISALTRKCLSHVARGGRT